MATTKPPTKANDYAVAMAMHKLITIILVTALIAYRDSLTKGISYDDLNRVYILLVAELQKIYDRNTELSSIQPLPIWEHFDILKNSLNDISESIDDPNNNLVTAHVSRVEKLYILSGEGEPQYSTDQKKLLEYCYKAVEEFSKNVGPTTEKNTLTIVGCKIPGYGLKYKPDGTILVNQVLRLKKVHAGSITEKLLEQSIRNPNTKFKPNLGKTSRNISTILSSAGFTPVLRDLFFPTISKDVIVFRPWVSREQADRENIDTEQLDLHLRETGAWSVLIREPK